MPQIAVTLDLTIADYTTMTATLGGRTPEDWLTKNCLALAKQIASIADAKKLAEVGLTSLDSLAAEEKDALVQARATKIALDKAAASGSIATG